VRQLVGARLLEGGPVLDAVHMGLGREGRHNKLIPTALTKN